MIVGGDVLTSHITKFEELKVAIQMLMGLLDSHSHAAPNAPPSMPMTPWVMAMLNAAKSIRAGVGG